MSRSQISALRLRHFFERAPKNVEKFPFFLSAKKKDRKNEERHIVKSCGSF